MDWPWSKRPDTKPNVNPTIAPNRRQFLKSGGAIAGAGLLAGKLPAVEPIPRVGGPRLRLAIAAYSFRESFDAPNSTFRMEDFIDYCAAQGVDGAELTSYYFKDTERARFIDVRRHAFLKGVSITGTAVGNTFTHPKGPERQEQIAHVKEWIDRAHWMGASHVRVFAGNLQGNTLEEAKKLCVAALEECGAYAGERGVFLGIENHGGIVAEASDLIDIVQTVQSPWVGVNLDTGNFHTEDPYGDLARCAPYAVNVQLKVEIQPRGQSRGPSDLKRLVRILQEAHYQGFVALEHEKAEDPFETIPGYLKILRQYL